MLMEQMSFFKVKEEPKFTDVKFMTAKEKDRAYKTFQKVIQTRDIERLDHNLYNHLHCHASFIAHYNFHGFKAEYSGIDGFRRFVNHFLALRYELMFCSDYRDINQSLVDCVLDHYQAIFKELDEAEKKREIAILKAIAKKHNFSLTT